MPDPGNGLQYVSGEGAKVEAGTVTLVIPTVAIISDSIQRIHHFVVGPEISSDSVCSLSARSQASTAKYKYPRKTVGVVQPPHSCLVIPGKVPCRGGPDEFRTMQIYMLTTTRLPHDGRIFEKEAKSLVKEHAVMIIASSEDGSVEETRDVHIVTVWNPSSTLLHPMTLWRALR